MAGFKYRVTMPRPGNQAIISKFAKAIKRGHGITTAATMAGIDYDTANRWLRQGEQELNAGEEQGLHVEFFTTFKDAEAQFVDSNLSYVHRDKRVKGKGWLPAMTLLERRRPQEFGRNQRIEVDSRTVTLNLQATLPEGAERALLEMLRDRLTPQLKAGDAQE